MKKSPTKFTPDAIRIAIYITEIAKSVSTRTGILKASESTRNVVRNNIRDLVSAMIGSTEIGLIDQMLVNALSTENYAEVRSEAILIHGKGNEKKRKHDDEEEEKENRLILTLSPEVHHKIKNMPPKKKSYKQEDREMATQLFSDAKNNNLNNNFSGEPKDPCKRAFKY